MQNWINVFPRIWKTGDNKLPPSERPKVIFTVLDLYFPTLFFLVLAFGIVAWFQRIPNRGVIPIVVLLYSLLLFPWPGFRKIVADFTVLLYPVIVIVNRYEYMIALACWYPVLVNFAVASLSRRPRNLFLFFFLYHVASMIIITLTLEDMSKPLWYLGLITNAVATGALWITIELFIENESLTRNLHWINKIVRHDIGNWTHLLTLGMSISRKNNQPVNLMVEEATNGLKDLALRLKSNLAGMNFVSINEISMRSLMRKIEKDLSGLVPFSCVCEPSLEKKHVTIDVRIMINCLLNLMKNAQSAGADAVEIEFRKGGNRSAEVLVRDNGRGFPAAIANAVLKTQVTSTSSGSGFGLLGVKHNLELMGCTIALDDTNTSGKGRTCFGIRGIPVV
jgi:signal transduction histidine kinase